MRKKIVGAAFLFLLASSPLRAQSINLRLYRVCDSSLFQAVRQSLEKCAPGSLCSEFTGICDSPDQEIGLQFWRAKWQKAFQSPEPFQGACPEDSFKTVFAPESEIRRADNLDYQELSRSRINAQFGEAEIILFKFQSQTWKCFPLIHYGGFAIPKNLRSKEFAIILNQGGDTGDPKNPLRSAQKAAELAADLGVAVMWLSTDQPPKKLVLDGRLYDLTRIQSELENKTLAQLCSIFSTLFAPYFLTDLHLTRRDPSFDFRTPMGITLRRAITVLEMKFGIQKVLMTGGSQWGISLFLPAAADSRVAGIAPSAMHTLIDMKANLEIVSQGEFTYGIKLITPRVAQEMLANLQAYPQFNDLSPVNLKITAPILIIGGTGDEFYPIQSFNLAPKLSPAQKYIYIMPNISHGFDDKKAEDSRRAFFRSIIFRTPDLDYEIKIVSERARENDFIVQANLQAQEKIKPARLYYACDDGNGSFNDEIWKKISGKRKGSDYEFLIPSGNLCPSLSYFIELRLSSPADQIYISSQPFYRANAP